MKITCTLILSLLFSLSLVAQTSNKNTYLIIRLPYHNDSSFYTIDAESGNPYSKEIYDLVKFNPKKATSQNASFFYIRNDTTSIYYNYFRNRTEALLFLTQNDWELISVSDEIRSTPYTQVGAYQSFSYTLIENFPVYYFRKQIK
jgi:hypothetical protein